MNEFDLNTQEISPKDDRKTELIETLRSLSGALWAVKAARVAFVEVSPILGRTEDDSSLTITADVFIGDVSIRFLPTFTSGNRENAELLDAYLQSIDARTQEA